MRTPDPKQIERKITEADKVLSDCKRLRLDPIKVLQRACEQEQRKQQQKVKR